MILRDNSRRNSHSLLLLLFLLSVLGVMTGSLVVCADDRVPRMINFQGYLTDSLGTPITATKPMRFTLYTGGSAVWSGTYSAVSVSNGTFSISLGNSEQGGSVSPIAASLLSGLDATTLVEVGVEISNDGGSTYESFASRYRMTSALFALKADTIDGYDSSDLAKYSSGRIVSSTGTAVIDSDGTWIGPAVSTSTTATNATALGGLAASSYAKLADANTWAAKNTFPGIDISSSSLLTLLGTSSYKILNDNGTLEFKDASSNARLTLNQAGNLTVAGTVTATSFSGTVPTSSLSGTIPTSSLSGTISTASLSGTILGSSISGSVANAVNLDGSSASSYGRLATSNSWTGVNSFSGASSFSGNTSFTGLSNSFPSLSVQQLSISSSITVPDSSIPASKISGLPTFSASDVTTGSITQGKIADSGKAVYTVSKSNASTALCESDTFSSNDAGAIAACINKAAANGGGTVLLKAGLYQTGTWGFTLASGVSLRGVGLGNSNTDTASGAVIAPTAASNSFIQLESNTSVQSITFDVSALSAFNGAILDISSVSITKNISIKQNKFRGTLPGSSFVHVFRFSNFATSSAAENLSFNENIVDFTGGASFGSAFTISGGSTTTVAHVSVEGNSVAFDTTNNSTGKLLATSGGVKTVRLLVTRNSVSNTSGPQTVSNESFSGELGRGITASTSELQKAMVSQNHFQGLSQAIDIATGTTLQLIGNVARTISAAFNVVAASEYTAVGNAQLFLTNNPGLFSGVTPTSRTFLQPGSTTGTVSLLSVQCPAGSKAISGGYSCQSACSVTEACSSLDGSSCSTTSLGGFWRVVFASPTTNPTILATCSDVY